MSVISADRSVCILNFIVMYGFTLLNKGFVLLYARDNRLLDDLLTAASALDNKMRDTRSEIGKLQLQQSLSCALMPLR